MRKLMYAALAVLAASQPAFADDNVTYRCQRYKSKCIGTKCYAIATQVETKFADKKKFPVTQPEIATYVIGDTGATETLHVVPQDANMPGAVIIPDSNANYAYVSRTTKMITLENKDFNGQTNIQVQINPVSGFYTHYLLHTDGSMKEIPIGAPFEAHFGWCEKAVQ